jgi:hypothetical protein
MSNGIWIVKEKNIPDFKKNIDLSLLVVILITVLLIFYNLGA